LTTIWVDGGFVRTFYAVGDEFLPLIVLVVLRSQEAKGFVLLKKRWVVERLWLADGCRRLVRDYEFMPKHLETLFILP
jgi:transposase